MKPMKSYPQPGVNASSLPRKRIAAPQVGLCETIYDVYWEGPFTWKGKAMHFKPHHVLYAIYGVHHLYGPNALLYLGKTDCSVKNRCSIHEEWVADEYDTVTIRVASVGPFQGWATWDPKKNPSPAPDRKIVEGVESLLLYAFQPTYNGKDKQRLRDEAKGMRIFNTGRVGRFLPELSYLYFSGDSKITKRP